MRIALAAFMSLICLGTAARAELVKLGDRVPDHSGVTYYDLMRQVVTDLELDPQDAPTAHTIVPYRHIEGEAAKTEPAGPLAVKYLEPHSIHADGATRLVLMADLGESDGDVTEFVLLALFDMTGKPKLLDVVEVGRDRLTGFADRPLTPLGHGTDLIEIDSDHFNSDEDFVNTELLFVKDDRFRLLDSIFTFDVKTCTSVLTEQPEVAALPDQGQYRSVLLTVQETRKLQPDAADCDEKPPRTFTRKFQAAYRWSARRQQFVTLSSNLKKLDAVNDRLMNPP